jgi:hypothetical protein
MLDQAAGISGSLINSADESTPPPAAIQRAFHRSDAALPRFRLAWRRLKEEFVQGIRMTWIDEAMTHAVNRAVV